MTPDFILDYSAILVRDDALDEDVVICLRLHFEVEAVGRRRGNSCLYTRAESLCLSPELLLVAEQHHQSALPYLHHQQAGIHGE